MPGPEGAFLARHLPLYLDFLAVEKGLAERSLEAYRGDLERFGVFLAALGRGTADVERDDLVRFLAERRAAGKRGRSGSRRRR